MKTKQAQSPKQFTCPMHPEIERDKPGKCPKCGMNLVERGKQAELSEMHDHR